jgi:hypothetical protein
LEQLGSQLAAPEIVPEAQILDRIDELVPLGTNFTDTDDAGWSPKVLSPKLHGRHYR